MAWDASRPVPWTRLAREWLVYVAIMAAIFLAFMRDRNLVGIFAGLLVSGPLYLAIGYVLAKFGYRRKTLREMRDEASTGEPTRPAGDAAPAGPRPKPPPTRRTGGSSQRSGGSRTRRR